ncbi:MAG: hypothetical protein V9F03_08125 [Microthrixaceae bacterium]
MVQMETGRLRRPTLVAVPLLLIALMGTSFTIWLALWAMANPDSMGTSFWVPFGVTAAIGVGGFALAKGCFIDIGEDVVRDVVCWIAIQRLDRASIESIRVRPGFWRLFEVTMNDGVVKVLIGASPSQFPARLFDSALEQDMADIDQILGD